MLAPMRSPNGATVTSPRLRSIAVITAAATCSGELVPTPGGSLTPGVGEHARVPDEARQDHGDADAGAAQVRAGAVRKAAQSELGGAVDR